MKTATLAAIVKGFAYDLRLIATPVLVSAAVAAIFWFTFNLPVVAIILMSIGGFVALVALAYTVKTLHKWGYTDGLGRYDIRVVDPVMDTNMWNVRRYPKTFTKMVMGRYTFLAVAA